VPADHQNRTVRTSLVQMACTPDRDANRDAAEARVREAAAGGAHIVCLQELFDAQYFPQTVDIAEDAGDFVVWTKRGAPSYQLAVTVDDARQGVTEIVRGDDLLTSAARQLLLWSLLADNLGWGPPPGQTHLPLVRGEDGRRLAKRHGDTRLTQYRELGVPPEAVIGLLAEWSGVPGQRRAMTTRAFCRGFDPGTMPRDAVTFTQEHDAWLRSFASSRSSPR